MVQALLEDLEARGLNPKRRYLFVIDGAKALRTGILIHVGSTTGTPPRRIGDHGP